MVTVVSVVGVMPVAAMMLMAMAGMAWPAAVVSRAMVAPMTPMPDVVPAKAVSMAATAPSPRVGRGDSQRRDQDGRGEENEVATEHARLALQATAVCGKSSGITIATGRHG